MDKQDDMLLQQQHQHGAHLSLKAMRLNDALMEWRCLMETGAIDTLVSSWSSEVEKAPQTFYPHRKRACFIFGSAGADGFQ